MRVFSEKHIFSADISLDKDAIVSVNIDLNIFSYRFWHSKSNATIHLTLKKPLDL